MIILGATGSIGLMALEIARRKNIAINALSSGKNIALFNKLIAEFNPKFISIQDEEDKHKLIPSGAKAFYGDEGILRLIKESNGERVLNALVGFSGVAPSLTTLEVGKKLLLANKESLVVAGHLIKSKIIPIDSEHHSLSKLLKGRENEIKKIYITASGGAFRDLDLTLIPRQTLNDALNHPTWKMGNKITIDSATMVNKLFEILEALHLFKIKEIDAVIERKSIVHSLVTLKDNSTLFHASNPSMLSVIADAISQDVKEENKILSPLDLNNLELQFSPIDINRYPVWGLKDELINKPELGLILNASNDIANAKFIAGELNFSDISRVILKSIDNFYNRAIYLNNLRDIIIFNEEVQEYTKGLI